jgi:hypothetical protein
LYQEKFDALFLQAFFDCRATSHDSLLIDVLEKTFCS